MSDLSPKIHTTHVQTVFNELKDVNINKNHIYTKSEIYKTIKTCRNDFELKRIKRLSLELKSLKFVKIKNEEMDNDEDDEKMSLLPDDKETKDGSLPSETDSDLLAFKDAWNCLWPQKKFDSVKKITSIEVKRVILHQARILLAGNICQALEKKQTNEKFQLNKNYPEFEEKNGSLSDTKKTIYDQNKALFENEIEITEEILKKYKGLNELSQTDEKHSVSYKRRNKRSSKSRIVPIKINNKKTLLNNQRLDINKYHIEKRFDQLDYMLNKNKELKVIIPGKPLENNEEGGKEIIENRNETGTDHWRGACGHCLGTGIAYESYWKPKGATKQWKALQQYIDTRVTNLKNKFGEQVEIGWVGDKVKNLPPPSSQCIHVFAANFQNWRGDRGNKIGGLGQAKCFSQHKTGVFGIITTGGYTDVKNKFSKSSVDWRWDPCHNDDKFCPSSV